MSPVSVAFLPPSGHCQTLLTAAQKRKTTEPNWKKSSFICNYEQVEQYDRQSDRQFTASSVSDPLLFAFSSKQTINT